MRGLSPRAPRIYRFRARMARGAGRLAPPSPFRPLSRRSGRFPAQGSVTYYINKYPKE